MKMNYDTYFYFILFLPFLNEKIKVGNKLTNFLAKGILLQYSTNLLFLLFTTKHNIHRAYIYLIKKLQAMN